ncbi:MAG: hypothetical protein ACT4QC_00845 [Planctomycetaceae bacterium]
MLARRGLPAILCVFLACTAGSSADDARDGPLASVQESISRRYKRFEDALSKIAESLRRVDPERADLLLRAIGQSKADRIATQMGEVIELLRENRQLGEAIELQADVVSQLHALLNLLLSEDRQKELKEEQARIRRYLEELNKIIAREKGNRADNERGMPADEVAGAQKKIAEQTGKLGRSIDKDDKKKQQPGRSSPSEAGKPEPGEGDERPGAKPSEDGENAEGESSKGESPDAKSPSGTPGKPQPAQPGQPQPGQPQPGAEGEAAPRQPSEQQPTAGRDELEKARRAMNEAIEKLKQQKRQEASDEQDEALAKLQKAKEKLEEILRQLREEERDRFLALLEARFQRMLALQLLVYDGTQKLSRTPADERSGRHASRSLELARQEEEIVVEATRAITLLREEGTAVAFPEAVEQVRDDMNLVVGRLERADVGDLTQAIEREIVDALEEMIEALQKEMEKGKEREPPQPGEAGQQSDPPLVDQLAELKMLRTLQLRVNRRTRKLGQLFDGEQAVERDVVVQLQNLADRQSRIQRATHDIVTGKNR